MMSDGYLTLDAAEAGLKVYKLQLFTTSMEAERIRYPTCNFLDVALR
jgi:hypothetical protein